MVLEELAEVSAQVAATSSRSRKTELLAELFARTEPSELPVVTAYLSGRLPQGRLGVGWRVLREPVVPAERASLTVGQVDAAFTEVAAVKGAGSQAERRRLVEGLWGAATEAEQRFLYGLVTGEVRQGALDAVAVEAVARASGVPVAGVRRAVMLSGSLEEVAAAVLAGGEEALSGFGLVVGRPVQPMLASSSGSVAEAVAALGPCAVEEKLDGIRVQVHRVGERVSVYTRTLDDITVRLPEVVELARALPAETFVLDGEVLALDAEGRPRSFQETAGRVGSRLDVGTAAETLPVSVAFFDVLAVEGRELLDLGYAERAGALAALVPEVARVRRSVVADPGAGARWRGRRVSGGGAGAGHEGVVVKGLDSVYAAGRRGAAWRKVKPVRTADLVVLGAEWGHGRRAGKLSNLHLGAREPDGSLVMLGKTFKGMTDEVLAWQTERLGELAESDDGHVVKVRPELVVEVAFDGLQRSSRYAAGVTLRFARLVRYREDKPVDQADSVASVRAAAGWDG
ncbi:ATP-dependent DNA ligase [Streptomyces sp. KE1]|uniref:ATP-dependent DNA ligase n=1 Tax=Streptomyces sp. KE1 TaxID=1638939 RepID=UPI00063EBA5A|nr:ATP-dependent DNA ligase [Streptomyces sp. KE1]KLJ01582.1 ATP-dependent DNA ligase [Streptomyces sp. KE1]